MSCFRGLLLADKCRSLAGGHSRPLQEGDPSQQLEDSPGLGGQLLPLIGGQFQQLAGLHQCNQLDDSPGLFGGKFWQLAVGQSWQLAREQSLPLAERSSWPVFGGKFLPLTRGQFKQLAGLHQCNQLDDSPGLSGGQFWQLAVRQSQQLAREQSLPPAEDRLGLFLEDSFSNQLDYISVTSQRTSLATSCRTILITSQRKVMATTFKFVLATSRRAVLVITREYSDPYSSRLSWHQPDEIMVTSQIKVMAACWKTILTTSWRTSSGNQLGVSLCHQLKDRPGHQLWDVSVTSWKTVLTINRWNMLATS